LRSRKNANLAYLKAKQESAFLKFVTQLEALI
jgi:hypothetical protein